jgi:general secretion pathway protein A
MYYDYFGLSEAPFSIAPNPEYLFMTERHQEALAHLHHGVESDGGFVLLTGDIGTGKTTVCRCFLDKLPEDTVVAFILNPFLGGRELLLTICQELNIKVAENATLRQLTESIYRYLLEAHAKGKQTVLLIDEAQHLHYKVLELIRLLTNLETTTQKLLKIILVGQPELNDTLAKPELTQLSQRITTRYHIQPLSFDETGAYIDYRLRMAGYLSEKKIFPKVVVKTIFDVTNGVPRLINVICDRALLGAYSQNLGEINHKVLKKAITEVRGNHQLKTQSRWLWVAGLLPVMLILIYFLVPPTLSLRNIMSFFAAAKEERVVDAVHMPVDKSVGNYTTETIMPVPLVNDGVADNTILVSPSLTEFPMASESTVYYVNQTLATDQLIRTIIKDTPLTDQHCTTIDVIGWQCRKAQSDSWSTLQRYNRPAVAVLVDKQNREYYVPIVGLSASYAKILTPDGIKQLPILALDKHWLGEFIYLWQPPKGFTNNIYFDSDGALVDWLANAFATIDNRDEVLAKTQFNSLLKKRVMLFQRENNLTEDGIAGIETLLKLNERLGIAVTMPQLLSESASTKAVVN